jgi:pimeloyl-ACP methyl ester carboxylesterase
MHVCEQACAMEWTGLGNLGPAVPQTRSKVEHQRSFTRNFEPDTGRVSSVSTRVIAMAWRRTAHTKERDEEFRISPDALTLNPLEAKEKEEMGVTFVAPESVVVPFQGYRFAMSTSEIGTIDVGDQKIAYLSAGMDNDGPLAVCLHGFPDSAHTWRHLLPLLASKGYRAIAPFLRGYAPTTIPADGRLQTAASAVDAIGLAEKLGNGRHDSVIIGHDWGAVITHIAACHRPELWSKVVTMAVPPGSAVGAAFLTNLAQIKRSWYMFFFQHPFADFIVGANDLAYIDMLWADWSPGYDASEDLHLLKPSLRAPENLQAALGYYRATLGAGYNDPVLQPLQDLSSTMPPQPLLYLHGRNDGCMGIEVAELARAEFPDTARAEFIDDSGHFLHLERPDVVNTSILDFLNEA